MRFTPDELCLLVIDVQERLARVVDPSVLSRSVKNILHLLKLAEVFSIPILATEQYPKGLGRTLPELSDAVAEWDPLEKETFSCWDASGFSERLAQTGRSTVVVTGMETHVCVYQTVQDLVPSYQVIVPADAVFSRHKLSWRTALDQMARGGAEVTVTEAVLFHALKRSGTDEFRVISRRLKDESPEHRSSA